MPTPPNHAAKNWVMTVYAPEADPRTLYDATVMKYLIVGDEVCPDTQRAHWQSFVQFHKKLRFRQVKAIFGNSIHIEGMRGTADEASEYCKKEGNFTEFGVLSKKAARTDLADAIQASHNMTFPELMTSEHAEVVARSMQYFRQLYANMSRSAGKASLQARMENATLKTWQTDLLTTITGPVDPRKIYWHVDRAGGVGKSFMANYLLAFHDATIVTHGKLADLTFAYNSEPIVVVDLARTQAEKIDHLYQFMEDLKNGRIFSPKYESGIKLFEPPHVVVFANFIPDDHVRSTIWTADRWAIKELS